MTRGLGSILVPAPMSAARPLERDVGAGGDPRLRYRSLDCLPPVAIGIALLAELKPERFPTAAVRWHCRLELEAPTLTLTESQFALAARMLLGDGEQYMVELLRTPRR